MRQISPYEISDNIFGLISKEWFLLTAGDKNTVNTMTASWGMAGELWSRRVVAAFVRNTRHSFGIINENEYFTMSFFGNEHRDALSLCGSKSGRDIDKIAATGLTPVFEEAPYFAEARMVFVCRKLYADDIKPEDFTVGELDAQNYGAKDYHRMFIGEIVKVYVAD